MLDIMKKVARLGIATAVVLSCGTGLVATPKVVDGTFGPKVALAATSNRTKAIARARSLASGKPTKTKVMVLGGDVYADTSWKDLDEAVKQAKRYYYSPYLQFGDHIIELQQFTNNTQGRMRIKGQTKWTYNFKNGLPKNLKVKKNQVVEYQTAATFQVCKMKGKKPSANDKRVATYKTKWSKTFTWKNTTNKTVNFSCGTFGA